MQVLYYTKLKYLFALQLAAVIYFSIMVIHSGSEKNNEMLCYCYDFDKRPHRINNHFIKNITVL